MMKHLKTLIPKTGLALLAATAWAQEPPMFYQDTYPDFALKSRLEAEAVLVG